MDDESRKIFVGGLSWETTEDGIKKHFSQFGEVIHAQVMLDGITKRSRYNLVGVWCCGFVRTLPPSSTVWAV
jgi:RNA recognition motif-containing protein